MNSKALGYVWRRRAPPCPSRPFIVDAAIVLAAAIGGVLLTERLRLGPVGYLIAGPAIGPAGPAYR